MRFDNATTISALLAALLPVAACQGDAPSTDGPGGQGPAATVMVTPAVLAETRMRPRDLDFNPRRTGELWVVNAGDSSVTIIKDATVEGTPQLEHRRDRDYVHFMPKPSGIAFGADPTNKLAPLAANAEGTFATCHESRDPRRNQLGQIFNTDFMGPVLWSSDLSVFATRNGMLGSHLDMLHQSPLCMGISWEGTGNIYWTYNGLSKSVARYDFGLDHGVGNDDHSDGYIWRFLGGQLGYVENVPSHVFYDRQEGALYIADTGNSRVLRLDPRPSKPMGRILPAQDEREGWEMMGGDVREVVTKASGHLMQPSGLEIFGDHLYVSDNATSAITKFRRDGTVAAVVKLELPPGSLSGMVFGPDQRLYLVDMAANRVLRIEKF